MGNPFLLQACLRLAGEQNPENFELGKKYNFSKEGHRLYQIMVPMDLRTQDWKFLARIVIDKYTIGDNKTEGTFIVVKNFNEEEKEIITKTFVSDEEVEQVLKS